MYMKTAVGLFGIHYVDRLNHWMGWKHGVDFEKTIDTFKNQILQNLDTHFFISTYKSNVYTKLLHAYKPIKKLILSNLDNKIPNNFNENFIRRNSRFLEVMKSIIDSKENFERIILTRFDLMFKQNATLSKLDIREDKINFLNKTGWGDNKNLCDDNFYVFSQKQFNFFYDTVNNIDISISSHEYKNYFKQNDINYMQKQLYYSHNNPFYYIYRVH